MPLTQIRNSNIDSSAQYIGFKNRIINGCMNIDQRNTALTASGYSVDRWAFNAVQNSKLTVQKSSIAPAGFTGSLGATSSSAYTPLTSDYFCVQQPIEGVNVSDLGWGTSSAQTVTLSFQVRSSLTGTFGGCILNNNANRSYPFSYTISSANTWTTISITIPGDTTGTWNTDNTVGMYVFFSLGAGATFKGTAGSWSAGNYRSATGTVDLVGTSGATFYITGVQLEKGSVATSFDYRDYGRELQMCQRYYEIGTAYGESSYAVLNSATGNGYTFKVTKRAAPTTTYPTFGGSNSRAGADRAVYVDAVARYFLSNSTAPAYAIETWTASAEL